MGLWFRLWFPSWNSKTNGRRDSGAEVAVLANQGWGHSDTITPLLQAASHPIGDSVLHGNPLAQSVGPPPTQRRVVATVYRMDFRSILAVIDDTPTKRSGPHVEGADTFAARQPRCWANSGEPRGLRSQTFRNCSRSIPTTSPCDDRYGGDREDHSVNSHSFIPARLAPNELSAVCQKRAPRPVIKSLATCSVTVLWATLGQVATRYEKEARPVTGSRGRQVPEQSENTVVIRQVSE